jgi:hypothetical protein
VQDGAEEAMSLQSLTAKNEAEWLALQEFASHRSWCVQWTNKQGKPCKRWFRGLVNAEHTMRAI